MFSGRIVYRRSMSIVKLCATCYCPSASSLCAFSFSWSSTWFLELFSVLPFALSRVYFFYVFGYYNQCSQSWISWSFAFHMTPFICKYVKYMDFWCFFNLHQSGFALTICNRNFITRVTVSVRWVKWRLYCRGCGMSFSRCISLMSSVKLDCCYKKWRASVPAGHDSIVLQAWSSGSTPFFSRGSPCVPPILRYWPSPLLVVWLGVGMVGKM